MEFEEVAKQEDIAWRQRSRTLWFKQGDSDTIFFWRMANSRRRFSYIDKQEVGREEVTNSIAINGKIVAYYQKLYAETEQWRLGQYEEWPQHQSGRA